jgi:uncharacterized membrane protein
MSIKPFNLRDFLLRRHLIRLIILLGTIILFLSSSLKHYLFKSTSFDLGIFDQATYLISQGMEPISSLMGFHILGDHAAFIFYPLSFFYRIYPSVHWLLLIQSISLVVGAYPIYKLANLSNLNEHKSLLLALTYLLYPAIFNIGLSDFHPETIALPAILWSVLSVRSNNKLTFCLALVIALSCKAVISLTIAAMGIWLILIEKRRSYGIIALSAGILWFLFSTQFIIPAFSLGTANISRHLHRYSDLGGSFSEIVSNIFTSPQLISGRIFSIDTLEYVALLFSPVFYIFCTKKRGHLFQLLPAIPTLLMNILSSDHAQKNLINQYSLPVFPFIFLAVINFFATQPNLNRFYKNKLILFWSLLAFLVLSRFSFFFGQYYEFLDTANASREAISRISTRESVLTTSEIAPHLSHRQKINFTNSNYPVLILKDYKYILLNTRHPGVMSNTEFSNDLLQKVSSNPLFNLSYQKDNVYLFTRN